jgi:hypothetical protein
MVRRVRGNPTADNPSGILEYVLQPACPACGVPPISLADFEKYAANIGRKSFDKLAADPRPALTDEFVVRHRDAGMKLREVEAYHGFTPSWISRFASSRGIPLRIKKK